MYLRVPAAAAPATFVRTELNMFCQATRKPLSKYLCGRRFGPVYIQMARRGYWQYSFILKRLPAGQGDFINEAKLPLNKENSNAANEVIE